MFALGQRQQRPTARAVRNRRRGAIIVLSALLMIAMLAMVAFSVDVGYIVKVNAELKRAADAGALAGAATLVDGAGAAETAIRQFVAANPVAGDPVVGSDVNIEFGHWNPDTQQFIPDAFLPSTVRVTLQRNNENLFFGRVLNRNTFDTQASAIAMEQPRDIMLVLDYSGSMCYDSQLLSLNSLGRTYVEDTLHKMWTELGSPEYGNLDFAPANAEFTGMTPTNSNMAQIKVKFGSNHDVTVTSTKSINQVRLKFSNGNTQNFYPGGTSATVKGSGSNNAKQVNEVWVKSGTNDNSGGNGEYFTDSSTALKNYFNLGSYPYPGGSWSDYFDYVKSDSDVSGAGYRKKYGYLTWINYLQEKQRENSQTPDLWKTSEQPITAVKDAVDLFVAYLMNGQTEDRLGMSLYASTGVLESELTPEMQDVATVVRQRQAAHYDPNTNISVGIQVARDELQDNARVGAFKMIVLMTDGQANLPSNTTYAKQATVNQAWSAAADRIPIVAIALGDGADTALMQQVADITGGVSFIIPGGQTAAQYEQELNAIFKQVADNKPLKLVGSVADH